MLGDDAGDVGVDLAACNASAGIRRAPSRPIWSINDADARSPPPVGWSSRPLSSSETTVNTGRTFPTSLAAPVLLDSFTITGRVRPLVIHRFQALLLPGSRCAELGCDEAGQGRTCGESDEARPVGVGEGELAELVDQETVPQGPELDGGPDRTWRARQCRQGNGRRGEDGQSEQGRVVGAEPRSGEGRHGACGQSQRKGHSAADRRMRSRHRWMWVVSDRRRGGKQHLSSM
ncbi:hypothetical protein [Pseudonocardia asaccharolytica]|uniref:hypothetical protein n=1 Tax=Pseudonocardia asaccharolytica TaxID=54010 RepID=UPI0012B55DFE